MSVTNLWEEVARDMGWSKEKTKSLAYRVMYGEFEDKRLQRAIRRQLRRNVTRNHKFDEESSMRSSLSTDQKKIPFGHSSFCRS